MKERPILFNAEMVRAILDGRKTMTRRLDKRWLKVKKGDRLWVKETIYYSPEHDNLYFKADNKGVGVVKFVRLPSKSIPAIFMPRWASRITLEATADARLERLQNISEEDAAKEGMPLVTYGMDRLYGPIPKATRIKGFGILWDSLNPKAPWLSNPEVVVIEFKKCDPKN